MSKAGQKRFLRALNHLQAQETFSEVNPPLACPLCDDEGEYEGGQYLAGNSYDGWAAMGCMLCGGAWEVHELVPPTDEVWFDAIRVLREGI